MVYVLVDNRPKSQALGSVCPFMNRISRHGFQAGESRCTWRLSAVDSFSHGIKRSKVGDGRHGCGRARLHNGSAEWGVCGVSLQHLCYRLSASAFSLYANTEKRHLSDQRETTYHDSNLFRVTAKSCNVVLDPLKRKILIHKPEILLVREQLFATRETKRVSTVVCSNNHNVLVLWKICLYD